MATEAVLRFFQGRRFWVTTFAVLLLPVFLCVIAGWIWYLDRHLSEARQTSLDTLWQEQTIRSDLEADQHTFRNWSNDLAEGGPQASQDFVERVTGLMKDNQAIIGVDFIDQRGARVAGAPATAERPSRLPSLNHASIAAALRAADEQDKFVYSSVVSGTSPTWAIVMPVDAGSQRRGEIVVFYDLNRLMEQTVPWWFIQRYDLELVQTNGQRVPLHDEVTPVNTAELQTLAFGPANSGLLMHVARHDRGAWWMVIGALALTIVALGCLVVWLLRVLQRWLNDRLEAQRALSDELRFREAMENSTVTGLVAFDLQGRIMYVNPAFAKMVGLTADQLVGGEAPFPFWPADRLDECATAYRAMLRGDNPVDGQSLQFCRSNGERLFVSLFSSLLVDGRCVARGWMASLYDTTALLQEREALSASREQLYTVLAGLEAAVSVSAQDDGRLLFRNRHHADVFRMRPEADCCLMPISHIASDMGGTSADFRDPINLHWYHLERRTIRWVDGALVLLDIVTDITAERQAADAARERDALLQRTAKLASLAEFASGIAHELNQPLAAIANYSAVVETCLACDPPQMNKVSEAALRIGDESRRAGQIIHSLRGAIQKRAVQTQVCDLRELLTEPLALLDPLMRKKNIKVVMQGRRKPTIIKCDPVMIEQVLLNLIRNAVEALETTGGKLPRDAIAVKIECNDLGVTVTVSDRGPGIQNPGNLFQAFNTTKSDGMGLGLAICRTVVENHGGHLWCESNPGGGARFAFRLPPSVVVQNEARVDDIV